LTKSNEIDYFIKFPKMMSFVSTRQGYHNDMPTATLQ